MKTTAKLLALLLALALLAGCGAQSLPADAPPSEPTASAAPTSAPEAEPEPTPTPEPTPEPTPIPETFPFDFSQTLADTEELDLEVYALGLDANGDWVFHLYMENRSRVVLNIRFLYQSINGITIEPFVYRLAIGDAVTREFRVFHEALEEFGSSSPLEWTFTLRVSSAEDNRDPFIEEPLAVCPFGEELAERYEFVPAEGDLIIMNNDLVTVYVTGYSQEGASFAIEYVAVSKTDKPLRLFLSETQNFSVNGRRASASLRDELGGHSTLIGYLPVEFTADAAPATVKRVHFLLLTEDPTDPDNRKLDRSVWVDLKPDYPLE